MNYLENNKQVLEEKLKSLWLVVDGKLKTYEREYRNKLSALFSQIQKDVLKNYKNQNVSIFDLEKYTEKFVNIYLDMLDKVFLFSKKRSELESKKEIPEDVLNSVKQQYVLKFIHEIAGYVIKTTAKEITTIIQSYLDGKITEEQLKKDLSYYFDKRCKRFRSRLISITETRRMHNVFYMSFMVFNGYKYKLFLPNPKTQCEICKPLKYKVFFYLEDITPKKSVPPLHPQNTAILLMLKDKEEV